MRSYAAASMLAVALATTALPGCHSASGPASPDTVLVGLWGADGGIVELSEEGGVLAFDCALGGLDEAVRPASDGVFSVSGWYSFAVGPEPYARQAALFRGRAGGTELALNVTLVVTEQEVEMLVLRLDIPGDVARCR